MKGFGLANPCIQYGFVINKQKTGQRLIPLFILIASIIEWTFDKEKISLNPLEKSHFYSAAFLLLSALS